MRRDPCRAYDLVSDDLCSDSAVVNYRLDRTSLFHIPLAGPQGIPGTILAVPMVVITRIVCDHLDHPYAKTLMRLLEGNVFEVRCILLSCSLCFISGAKSACDTCFVCATAPRRVGLSATCICSASCPLWCPLAIFESKRAVTRPCIGPSHLSTPSLPPPYPSPQENGRLLVYDTLD